VNGRRIYLNLKMKILSTGLRQNQLAKLVGIDEAHLSRIIHGVREPGPKLRLQIAKALGCDEEWLFQCITQDDSLQELWRQMPSLSQY
jgi:transcriptional regulator with XRE-family HTH domain